MYWQKHTHRCLEKYYFNSRALNWQQGDNVNYKLLSLESC